MTLLHVKVTGEQSYSVSLLCHLFREPISSLPCLRENAQKFELYNWILKQIEAVTSEHGITMNAWTIDDFYKIFIVQALNIGVLLKR